MSIEYPIYNPGFVAKIKEGDEDIKAGQTKTISLDDIFKESEDFSLVPRSK